MLTIADVCKQLNVDRATVHRLIRTGALAGAINVSPGNHRACWRIPNEVLEEFKLRRSGGKVTPAKSKSGRSRAGKYY